MSRYLLCRIVKLCTFDFTTILLFNSVYFMAMMAAFGSIRVCYCVLVSEKEREKCNQSISQIHHVYERLLEDRPNEPVYTYSFIIIHVRNANSGSLLLLIFKSQLNNKLIYIPISLDAEVDDEDREIKA